LREKDFALALAGARFPIAAVFVLAVMSLMGASSSARASTGFQVNFGFSTLHLKAGATFDKDGGMGLEIRPQIDFEFNALNSAVDLFYQGRLGSNFGAFPLSRVGVGIYYYPTGLPLQTVILDNGVTLSQNHFAPFLVGNMTFTTVAVTDATQTPALSFNGLTLGYQIGGGGEMPLSQTWSMVVTFYLEGTIAGGSTGGATNNSGLNYSLVNGFLGVAIHP
jgi:hypothetical protein